VKDDSLGSVGGSKAAALNAGQALPSREEVESKTQSAKSKADARKRDAEARRAQVAREIAGEGDGQPSDENASGEAPERDLEAENADLRARLAALEASSNRKPVTTVKTAKRVAATVSEGVA
jgi:hypothetical protein